MNSKNHLENAAYFNNAVLEINKKLFGKDYEQRVEKLTTLVQDENDFNALSELEMWLGNWHDVVIRTKHHYILKNNLPKKSLLDFVEGDHGKQLLKIILGSRYEQINEEAISYEWFDNSFTYLAQVNFEYLNNNKPYRLCIFKSHDNKYFSETGTITLETKKDNGGTETIELWNIKQYIDYLTSNNFI